MLPEDAWPDDGLGTQELVDIAKVAGNNITKKKYHILVYTRWRNLKKTSDMEVGSIGFHDGSKVKSMLVVKDKEIIKRIEKTKDVCLHNLPYTHTNYIRHCY